MRIFPLVICEVTTSKRDRAHHNAHIEANQTLDTMHSLLIFDVFTHNLCALCIEYSWLETTTKVLGRIEYRSDYCLLIIK